MLRRKIYDFSYKRKSKTRIIETRFFLIFFLFISLNHNLYSQIWKYEQIESNIDSVLILGNITEARSLLEQISEHFSNDDKFDKIYQSYSEFFDALKLRSNYSNEEKRERVNQYLKFETLFQIRGAGKDANRVYKKFLAAYNKNNLSEAIIFYSIAYFLKERFISALKENFNTVYNKYEMFYNNSEYDSALTSLSYLQILSEGRPIFDSKLDSLQMLKEKTYQKQQEVLTYQKEFQTTKEFESNFQFSASTQLIYNMAIENVVWQAQINNSVYSYYVRKIPGEFGWGFRMNFEYGITNYLSIGTQVGFGNFSISSFVDPGKLLILIVNQEISYSGIYIYGKFYFRNKYGARPFINLGIGSNEYTREKIFLFEGYGIVPEKTFGSTQILADIGVDYVFESMPSIVYGFFISAYYNIRESNISSWYNLASALKVGVQF